MALSKVNTSRLNQNPRKPILILDYLKRNQLMDHFEMESNFKGFKAEDFLIAHTEEYVSAFFRGGNRLASSNQISWSKELIEVVRFTNAAFYHAVRTSILQPESVSFCTGSDFHHAMPNKGHGFCTFSGQVIAAVKIYQEFGLKGCFFDCDAHYGNSIEDSRSFVPDLNKALPKVLGNINPEFPNHKHKAYMSEFRRYLGLLREALLDKEIHYVMFGHGADSHEDDDWKGQLTLEEWIEVSDLFYQMIAMVEKKSGRSIPLTLSLMGGYRKDDYQSVLGLHALDLVSCLNHLCGKNIQFKPKITLKKKIKNTNRQ